MRSKQAGGKRFRPGLFFIFLITLAYLALAPFYFVPALAEDPLSGLLTRSARYRGALTVWQVDCFPGGQWSRAAFLAAHTAAFELHYPGVYVQVRQLTLAQARLLLSQGAPPDVISFGGSLAGEVAPLLAALPAGLYAGLDARLAAAGQGYALPWCYGGYILFSANLTSLSELSAITAPAKNYALCLPKTSETLPLTELTAIFRQGGLAGERLLLLAPDSNEVWDVFNYQRKALTMLGSQRELYRMAAAQQKDKARSAQAIYLSGYTDLVQYFGAVKTEDPLKRAAIENLLGYFTSEAVQKDMEQIGMYPALANLNLRYALPQANEQFAALALARVPPVFARPPKTHQQMLQWLTGG